MLKIKHSQLNWLLAGMTIGVMGVSIAPASAQRVIVIDGGYGARRRCEAACRQTSPSVGSFIYGSPIPTPMPVDPTTGLIPQRTHYYNYSYPQIRQNVRNSILINPTLINPAIRDSTIVNPVIIDNSWHRRSFTALTAAMRYIPKSESFDTTGQGEKLYCIIAVSAVAVSDRVFSFIPGKGLPTNKLPNLVRWAKKPAFSYWELVSPTPQEVVKYFFICKSLKRDEEELFTPHS